MNHIKSIIRLFGMGISKLMDLLLFIYQYTLSPMLHMLAPGSGCRYVPTCSQYARDAVRQHGPIQGLWLALRRLARCHPWGSHGYDPVPEKKSLNSAPVEGCGCHHHSPVSSKNG